MLNTGQQLGPYLLLRKLGSGGFGEVFLAKDAERDQVAAIKVLHQSLSSDPQFQHRMIAEASVLERLHHPNIVEFREIRQDESGTYIVTEFLEGESLRCLQKRDRLKPADALSLTIQIGEALGEAHRLNIVHRDIKPENVIIHPQRGAVLLDFGIARLSEEGTVTMPGKIMGTWKYMSPEQLRGERVDFRSDIFSLGIVLYESLVGQRPFSGEYDAAVVYAILNEEPRPLPADEIDIPKSVGGVIRRALQKKPQDRYQSVSELVEDLRRISEGRAPIHAVSEDTALVAPQGIALAVLYLRNLGSEKYEYIAYGITEDLINDMSRVSRLKISPMRSVLSYREPTTNLRTIVEELGVDYIVDGSLAYHDEVFTVIVQLIDARVNQVLWSAKWEGDNEDLVCLKSSLLSGIFKTLKVDYESNGGWGGEPTPEVADPVAYEYYLRGKYLFEHKKSAADVEVAAGLFNQALRREPSLVDSSIGLARIQMHEGNHRRAIQELETALRQSRQKKLGALEADIEFLLADAWYRLADWDQSSAHADRSRELSRAAGDLAAEAKALTLLVDILEPQARFVEAIKIHQRIVKLNQQLQRKDKLAGAIKSIAVIHHRRGQFDLALHHYHEALELCRSQGQIDIEAKVLNNIGLIQHQLGKEDEASSNFRQALQLHRQLGEFASVAVNLNNLGVISYTLGQYADAMQHFVEAKKAAEEVGDRKNLAMALENQGKVQVVLGNYDFAVSLNTEAKTVATELHYPLVMVMAERNLGDIALFQGDVAAVQVRYANALDMAEKAELINEQYIVLMSQVRLMERTAQYDSCRMCAERALGISTKLHTRKQASIAAGYRNFCRFLLERDHRYLRKLRDYLRRIDGQVEPYYSIAIKRLLAQALLERGGDSDSCKEAVLLLEQALESARKYGVHHEQVWIMDCLIRATANLNSET